MVTEAGRRGSNRSMLAQVEVSERRPMKWANLFRLSSAVQKWEEIFSRAGKRYAPPTLVMFSGAAQSSCGSARAAMGPFYCPINQKVYLDTSFFQDLRDRNAYE
jgi:predicted metalloprotease